MKDKNNIIIVDTTLRDGEQTAGVVIANREKVRIAKFLNELGVHQIEAGIPVMGGDEKKAIRAICRAGLKASIMGWNRPVIKDIEASLDCGLMRWPFLFHLDIHIKHKLKATREWVLEQMVKATNLPKGRNEDFSQRGRRLRSDLDFLIARPGRQEAGRIACVTVTPSGLWSPLRFTKP